jgi:hypothetical protein
MRPEVASPVRDVYVCMLPDISAAALTNDAIRMLEFALYAKHYARTRYV